MQLYRKFSKSGGDIKYRMVKDELVSEQEKPVKSCRQPEVEKNLAMGGNQPSNNSHQELPDESELDPRVGLAKISSLRRKPQRLV